MKKYIYSVLILSLAGALVSGALLIQHFNPDSGIGIILCGDEFDNPCIAISQSEYSTFLGIPLAAYGLFFYLLFMATILIADYSKGKYYNFTAAILLPLSILSLVIDLILISILIIISEFCTLCLITYIINILLFVIFFFWFRDIKAREGISFFSIYKNIFLLKNESSHKKAAFSTYILLTLFLLISVLLSTYTYKMKTVTRPASKQEINSFIKRFYLAKIEDIVLPESKLILGNHDADVTIIAFTDFLCSACYQFYTAEKYLFSKFKKKLRVIYYNFPLDKSCNKYLKKTVYNNSCNVSKAIITASRKNIFKDYLIRHFRNYKEYKFGYNSENLINTLRILNNDRKEDKIDENKFIETMNSVDISEKLDNQIESSRKHNIHATPTLFIGNRRIVGVPPKEMLEAVIRKELEKNN